MPADFARAREQDPFKQAEKVTPKATPALPRMGENGQAPIKKGIENNIAIRKMADEGKLKPYICKEFNLQGAKSSIQFLSKRKLIGKVVVTME